MKTFSPGYWIISIALVLSFSIPCYAQLKTQSYFTPEGTRWKLDELCKFESYSVDPSTLITEIGFYADRIWLWNDNAASYSVLNAKYKNRLISKFYGSVNNGSWPGGTEVSGYVISFLKFGKLSLVITYVQPPWWAECPNTQITTQMFPLPTCSEVCDTTITKIDDNFSPEP